LILYLKFIKEYLVINFDTKLKWKLKIISILLRNVFKYSIHLPLDVPFSTCSSSMSSMYILSLFLCEPFSFSLPFNLYSLVLFSEFVTSFSSFVFVLLSEAFRQAAELASPFKRVLVATEAVSESSDLNFLLLFDRLEIDEDGEIMTIIVRVCVFVYVQLCQKKLRLRGVLYEDIIALVTIGSFVVLLGLSRKKTNHINTFVNKLPILKNLSLI